MRALKLANAENLNSVDQGTFPFYRSEDIEEERLVSCHHLTQTDPARRLLYVACTRAQSLLYILYSRKRQVAGKTKFKTLSDFVSVVCEKDNVIISLSGLDSVD